MRGLPLAVGVLLAACACSSQDAPQGSSSSPSQETRSSTAPTPSPLAVAVPTIADLLARCPTPAELASVDASVSITFTSDPSAGTLVCTEAQGSRDLTHLQERAYQAALLFSWIKFDAPLPWTNLTLDAWFAQAIHGIDFRGDTSLSYCCEPGGVIVIQTQNLFVMTRTDDPYRTWDGVRSLAALYVHEARHNEGFPHTCGTRDNTIAELGAWGVQFYFQLWLGEHSDPAVVPDLFQKRALQDAMGLASSFCGLDSPTPTS